MDTQEFKSFMEDLGFGEYAELFINENLTEETVLASLTSDELSQMGIPKLGDRKMMIEAFSKFKPKKPSEPVHIVHEPVYTPPPQTPPKEEKKGGVWIVVGVLLAIVLGLIIIGSL